MFKTIFNIISGRSWRSKILCQ